MRKTLMVGAALVALALPAKAQSPLMETAASSGVLSRSGPVGLYSLSVDAVTATTELKLLIFDAATLPGDGAVTPYKCVSFKGDGTLASLLLAWSQPLRFNTGIAVAVSSNTSCGTKTNVSATISGQVQ